MINIPKKIYLQIGKDCSEDIDFNELSGVTHCKDQIFKNDIEYVLPDELNRKNDQLQAELATAQKLINAILFRGTVEICDWINKMPEYKEYEING